jgi:hypothetical protein
LPADATGNTVMSAKIATGEIEDFTMEDGKNAGAGAHRREGAGGRLSGQKAVRDC